MVRCGGTQELYQEHVASELPARTLRIANWCTRMVTIHSVWGFKPALIHLSYSCIKSTY